MKLKYIITGLLLLLLIEMPFFSVLGVEHVLANAEPDGHAHSEFDLCDWLQIQTTGSLTFHVDLLSQIVLGLSENVHQATVVIDKQPSLFLSSPRAPPLSKLS